MKDTYDRTLRKWAARRFKADVNRITSVSLYHEKGYGGCDTCDYGGECAVNILIRFTDGKSQSETIEADFGELLAELLASS